MLPASSCQPSPNTPPGFDQPALAGTWQRILGHVQQISPNTLMLPGPDGCLVNGESFGGTYPLFHATSLAQSSYTCTDARSPSAGPFFAVTESDFTILEPGDK